MPGGLGPRFALEAGFLILLAAVAAYARLDATEIILVMAAGWVLAAMFEVFAARRERIDPGTSWERRESAEMPADDEEQSEERRLSWFRRPQETTAPPVDADMVSEPSPSPPPAPPVDDDATGEIALPKRRRWFRRGGPEPEVAAGEATARPSARHVRLIRGSTPGTDEVEQPKDAEAGS